MKTGAAVVNLKALDRDELEAFFVGLGAEVYRGRQTFRRLHNGRATSLAELRELPVALREKLSEVAIVPSAVVEHRSEDAGGTEKVILALPTSNGATARVEAVWIPSDKRRTVCVSCQAGCSLDCSFCATGSLRFEGNLEAWQIVEQIYALEALRGEKATNVVYMGMGEPFHNYDAVLRSAELLCHPEGAGLGARRITISTAGVRAGIDRFVDEGRAHRLAISLHSTDDRVRSRLMRINDRHPISELLASARRYTRASRRRVTFEYILIDGVNMGTDDLERMVGISRTLRCKWNLIPLNAELADYRRPSDDAMAAFHTRLRSAGLDVYLRGSPGLEVNGACGMLALRSSPGKASTHDPGAPSSRE